MKKLQILLLSDGKMGDIIPMQGIAKRLLQQNFQGEIIEKIIKKNKLNFLNFFGFINKQDKDIFNEPLPDIVLAANWRTLPHLKHFKKIRKKNKIPLLVFFKNPRTMYNVPDLIWTPEHDKIHGKNIISTLTSPHPFSEIEIAKAKKRGTVRFSPWCKQDDTAPTAIILGGNSKHITYTHEDSLALVNCLTSLPATESLIVIPSRRTPASLIAAVKTLANNRKFYIWQGEGDNPYSEVLAFARRLIVSGDSHNMVSEAVAMGKPVYVWQHKKLPKKFIYFLNQLKQKNLIKIIDNKTIENWQWDNDTKLDESNVIVKKIISML